MLYHLVVYPFVWNKTSGNYRKILKCGIQFGLKPKISPHQPLFRRHHMKSVYYFNSLSHHVALEIEQVCLTCDNQFYYEYDQKHVCLIPCSNNILSIINVTQRKLLLHLFPIWVIHWQKYTYKSILTQKLLPHTTVKICLSIAVLSLAITIAMSILYNELCFLNYTVHAYKETVSYIQWKHQSHIHYTCNKEWPLFHKLLSEWHPRQSVRHPGCVTSARDDECSRNLFRSWVLTLTAEHGLLTTVGAL